MFGRKGKVTITDAGVTVIGDVDLVDNRTKREVPSYYPIAEEARKIEPEIREDLVEEAVRKTLEEVEDTAKRGGLRVATVSWTHVKDYEPLSPAEKKMVIIKLESLGYTYLNSTITW